MLVRFVWMSVHSEKVNQDKEGFIERVLDCFGRDLRPFQLLFVSDTAKSF